MKKIEKSKIKYIIGAAIVLLLINYICPGLFDQFLPVYAQSRTYYKQAKKLQTEGKCKDANEIYDKISNAFGAYDIVLYQKSKCAVKLGDEKTNINSLKEILSSYSGSLVASVASYNLGQAYIRTNHPIKAEKQFLYTIDNFPNTNYAIGSYYYLGLLYKKEKPEKALFYWSKYLEKSPDGRFSLDCINGIKKLKANFNQHDYKNLAISLFKSQRYKEANSYFDQIPDWEDWYYRAKIDLTLGNTRAALATVKEGIDKYADSVDREQLLDAMKIYVRLNPQPELKSWDELAQLSSIKDIPWFYKAELLPKTEAAGLYQKIFENYPQSYYASEAQWSLFWSKYTQGEYTEAIGIGLRHIESYKNTKAAPKILFWTAKAYEKINQKSAASGLYHRLLSTYPDSYYAFRADGRLKAIETGNDNAWKTTLYSFNTFNVPKPSCPYSDWTIRSKFGNDILELLRIGDYDTVVSLVSDPFLQSWAQLKGGMVTQSIITARNAMSKTLPKPSQDDPKWKLIYPLYYVDDINRYSNENNLNSILVLSLIKEESHFNPVAISGSNARGLMQMMPGTANDISRWYGYSAINPIQLFTPSVNIKYGTAYLKRIKEQLNNTSLFAVAAYNGGPIAVKRWLKSANNDDMDQFIENIPYNQTRDYVKKVWGSYWNYKRIYGLN